ncbi:hypothetical protein N7520_008351 [Penicillium odoratum]|uniref:uncharacterized protein n=1 Tax=Penicillium odoratum TaxID=1167516 RepID=UPI002547CB1A|nr:uncharacterized protein N7520_008351 [Penicillium odoratum]KAJ5761195.1 hypothetical protein N7520_008351 [Penicillium odoratum]
MNSVLSRWLLLLGSLAICALGEDVVIVTVTSTETSKTVYETPVIPSPASYISLPEFKKVVLQVSNEYRGVHEADEIVWNETLVEYARHWAETCLWKHSVGFSNTGLNIGLMSLQGGPYGENLAFGYSNASSAVEAWGDEGRLYDFKKPTGFTEATGHFTQLVWRATEEVGCAAVNCGYTEDLPKVRRDGEVLVSRDSGGSTRAQGWYVVCEYTPAGNVVGDHDSYFKKNVLPSKSSKTSSNSSATESASTNRPNGSANRHGVGSMADMVWLAIVVVRIGMSLYT